MTRTSCLVAALVLSAPTLLPGQSRDEDFGRSEAEWCRDARDADVCEVREETIPNLNAVSIDARGMGGVSVRGWDRGDVHVRVRVTAYARSDGDARALIQDTQLTTTDGRILMTGPRRERGGSWFPWPGRDREWWSASYEVQVPRNAGVTAHATNGGVRISGVRGAVEAETTNGGLVLRDVSGNIRGRAVNGGVTVELGEGTWQGPGIDLRTTNGGVRLSLPPDVSADLEARTVNGGIEVDFPVTVQGVINRRTLRGTIGAGGPPIRVATTNGGVRISRR